MCERECVRVKLCVCVSGCEPVLLCVWLCDCVCEGDAVWVRELRLCYCVHVRVRV